MLLVCAGLWIAVGLATHWLTLSWLLIAVFLTIFSQALAQANTTSLALSPFKNKRGAAGTLYGGFQMLVTFATSAVISHLSANPINILMACYGILGIIGVIALSIQRMMRPNSTD